MQWTALTYTPARLHLAVVAHARGLRPLASYVAAEAAALDRAFPQCRARRRPAHRHDRTPGRLKVFHHQVRYTCIQ
jgi:hypothetical protein